MQQHKKPSDQGGFKGFFKRIFSTRADASGSAGAVAEPLNVEPDPSRPKRKGPAHK